MVLLVLAVLAAFVWHGMPPIEGPADPTDATYIPRPEWYFLGLFQLLKYFPGKWEVVGAMVIPGLAAGGLALLPWIDRGPARDPRQRRAVIGAVLLGVAGVVTLTTLGWRDRPVSAASPDAWSLREIGGRVMARKADCARCHVDGGSADPIDGLPAGRGPEWLAGHVLDPEMIAPGLREPPVVVNEREAAALVAYARRASLQPYPGFPPHLETVGAVFARYCVGCHKLDGDGGKDGPDLSHERGQARRCDAAPVDRRPGRGRPGRRDAVLRRSAERRTARRDVGVSGGAEVTELLGYHPEVPVNPLQDGLRIEADAGARPPSSSSAPPAT